MKLHDALDTRPAHRMLARQIWTALRGLGLDHGWVTCIGMDAATFTGHITPQEYGDAGSYAEWTGPIRPAGDVYDAVLMPQLDTDPPPDAIIANLPYANLHMRSPRSAKSVDTVHEELLTDTTGHIAPGGFLVALTSRQLMDGEHTGVRQTLAQAMDLVGALRLPGTVYHPALSTGQTAPTDLLVLRRRQPGEPNGSAVWAASGPVVFPGGQARVNSYFTNHYPHYVLGEVGFIDDPDGDSRRIAVLPSSTPLEPAVRLGLAQIVHQARANGLTARPLAAGPEPAPPGGGEIARTHRRLGRGPSAVVGG
ncbi:hypothetical protein [Promicromonospora sp. NPDC023987]|uniref:hypothetical protein n=1 Tax=Promicromonospora sp. NPDC023987 TaxID=3155360 RepID=UPI0033E02FB1